MYHSRASVFAYFLILLSSIGMSACANQTSSEDKTATSVETIGATDIPERHRQVLTAFDLADAGTPENLLKAAQYLEQIGAQPMMVEGDRVRQWQEIALALKPDLANQTLPFRGRVKGPAYREYALAPGESETLREIFFAAEKATLSLNPKNSEIAFDVREAGESGPVCNFPAGTTTISCEWIPIYTAPYAITLTNSGDTVANFLLVSN